MNPLTRLIDTLTAQVKEVSVQEAHRALVAGDTLIDIREKDEYKGGTPSGSNWISKGMLEMQIDQLVPDVKRPIYLMCGSGKRSLIGAASLLNMGYEEIYSIRGGFNEWKINGLPFEVPNALSDLDYERYKRHILIPEIGEKGQEKLSKSRVLVVGAGGIGSPVAWYLAAAGVGTIGIVDDDVVDRSNLQRQILHTEEAVGTLKVESAVQRLKALNPSVDIVPLPERLTVENVDVIFSQYDVIVDGTDNFTTRYLISDACVKNNVPNVHGSVYRFEGQVSVFWPGSSIEHAPCYRCVYPLPPPPEMAPSCAESGVLGVLPGTVGTLCATEVLKLLLGIGENAIGQLINYNALDLEFNVYHLSRNENCKYCHSTADDFPEYETYAEYCTS